jgi:hypothetical protein
MTICLLASVAHSQPEQRPSPELRARYLSNAVEIKNKMIADYRELLTIYYEYKKKSATPGNFPNSLYDPKLAKELKELAPETVHKFSQETVTSFAEFSSTLYNEFAAQLDSDPRLAGNQYREFMRSYGGSGADNDVLQRLYMHFDKPFSALDSAMLELLHEEISGPVTGLGINESKQVFADVSLAAGYPANRQTDIKSRVQNFKREVADLVVRYRLELRALNNGMPQIECGKSFAKIKPSTK